MPRHTVFFYGSLRDETLLSLVLGRDPESVRLEPAVLPGHEIREVLGEGFPCVVPAPGSEAPGAVLRDAAPAELSRLRFFENDEEYDLAPRTVRTAQGEEEALVCVPRARTKAGAPWSYETWPETDRLHQRECAREVMALYDLGADWSDPGLWPGIRARGAARLAALRAPSPAPLLGGRAPEPAETVRTDYPYAGFFAVEERQVRVPTFVGGRTEPLKRVVFASGDAVTVLPYDPRADLVMLTAQWRAGPHARGDARPFPTEVVAGRLDDPEDPEAAGRREAREEAGLTLGRMERAAAFYASPGCMAEHVTAFVAEADLSGAGGVGGRAEEHEDILSVVVPFDEAMAMVDRAEIDTGPALVALLWLARHRDRLRAAWT